MYERIAVMRIICLSFASLALLFTGMLIGTYVDASHQGLSCPDWPLCPNGLASYAAKKLGIVRKTAIAAGIIVVVQIVLGMFVVNTKLEALLVATHLSTGVFLFALILITFVSSFRLTKVTNHTSNY